MKQTNLDLRRRVPRHIFATAPGVTSNTYFTRALVGGAAAGKLPTDLRIWTTDEIWAGAPREDRSEDPDQNRQQFDLGPAIRIGY